MPIKFYLDEDVPVALSQALNNRNIDAIATKDVDNRGNTDLEIQKPQKLYNIQPLSNNILTIIRVFVIWW
jgi:predicted nuclease of predicted toxin-antitoxin system